MARFKAGAMRCVASAAAVIAGASAASGQLMILDNREDRIMLFSAVDGSLIDPNWITPPSDGSWSMPSQPQAVEMLGDEIWISGQWYSEGFRGILRLDQQGNLIGRFSTGDAQPYGISTNGTNALVAIDPGSGIYTLDGVEVGVIYTLGAYDIEYYQGGFIAGSTQNGALELFDQLGNYVSDFATDLDWPQQIVVQPDNSVITVNYLNFSQPEVQGVYHYNADGTIRTFISTGALGTGLFGVMPRGAVLLENGNYLFTAADGVYVAAADGAGGFSFSHVAADVNAFQIGTFTGTLPPQCACEMDGNAAQVDVFDLLAYLDLWFAGDAAAELDGAGGVDVFDLLSFLDCWFPASAGEPC